MCTASTFDTLSASSANFDVYAVHFLQDPHPSPSEGMEGMEGIFWPSDPINAPTTPTTHHHHTLTISDSTYRKIPSIPPIPSEALQPWRGWR